MLGEKTLFLVHLTMFHMEEHMFQFVLRASLPDVGMKTYRRYRLEYPDETYFLGNTDEDQFTVPSIKNGRRTFKASIWRGIPKQREYNEWPWKHQPPIVSDMLVTIERIVYYRHFDFNLNYPQSLTYVLFGAEDEAHLDHYQVKEPDFDHIASLKRAPSWLPLEELEAGVHINFPEKLAVPPGVPAAAYCDNPIPPGPYKVQYAGQSRERDIEVGNSWWCSAQIVNANNPCPAPK
ncbi:MAG: hypothetical protein JO165_00790 [Candidatus Eremiobacteraeota bacterium]|nr:hypothetical protein [Candidatus Eremiobacteraeota bacterium]